MMVEKVHSQSELAIPDEDVEKGVYVGTGGSVPGLAPTHPRPRAKSALTSRAKSASKSSSQEMRSRIVSRTSLEISSRKSSNRCLYGRARVRSCLNSRLTMLGRSLRPSKISTSDKTLRPKFCTWFPVTCPRAWRSFKNSFQFLISL
jgi:hypothetical protein